MPASDMVNELMNKGLCIGYIKTILGALKYHTQKEDIGKIQEYAEEIKKISAMQQREEKYINKFEKIDWNNIPKVTGVTVDDLIIGLYTMFPPRRIIDYAYMTYVIDERDVVNSDENYYIKNINTFVFQNYKLIKSYGVQRFAISHELGKLINDYVLANHIVPNDPLIKYCARRPPKNKFNKYHLAKKLNKIFGTSVDGIRHSYITWLYTHPKNLYNIDDTSRKMGHSIIAHLNYLDKENKII
jgi:hypothetical protein